MTNLLPLGDAWETESRHAIPLEPAAGQSWRFLLMEVDELLYPLLHRKAADAAWLSPGYGRNVEWRFWEAAGESTGERIGFDRRIPTFEGDRLLHEEPATVARWLLLAHQTDKPTEWHYSAAAAALTSSGIKNLEERNALAEAVRRECCKLAVSEDLDTLNEVVLNALDRLGEPAKDLEALRAKVAERPLYFWAERDEGGKVWRVRFGRSIALALWAPRARRRPALVRALVMDELVAVQTRQLFLPTMESRELRAGKRIVATIDPDVADPAAVDRGLEVLRKPAGNRLVKSLVLTAHRQHEDGETDPRTVQYDGGWSGLAEAIRYTHRDFSNLKDLAQLGRHVQWATRDGIARGDGWWMYSEKRGGLGSPGFVRFILNDCLMPGFATELARDGAHSLRAREARRLVPELPYEPPTGGLHECHQGAVWTLHRLFLVELVDHAEELAEHGLVVVPNARWRKLAKDAGLPTGDLDRVLDSWVKGESDAAPKLVERDGDGFRLAADVYQLEHDFLVTAGVARQVGRRGGRIRKRQGG